MGTYSANILPNATGLNLGSPSQRWDVFSQALTADSFTSNSANPASTGTVNLGTSDSIAWRNAANGADVLLHKSQAAGALPADTLQWPNGISAAEFITATANPSATGVVRLAAADAAKFRNNANNADLNGISLSGADVLAVGDAAGISTSGNATINGNATITGSAAVTGNVTAVNVTATGIVQAATLTSTGALNVSTNKTQLDANGLLTKYNNQSLAGQGIGQIIAAATRLAQSGAIGTTTLFTATTTGLYRLNYSLRIDTAGNAVNLTGTFGWQNAAAQSLTTANIACNTLGANSTSALGLGSIVFSHNSGQIITYATAISGAIGAGLYELRLVLEFLG